MTIRTLESAAVLGTGMMGPGIALTFAIGGLRSTIISRNPETAERGLEKARLQLRQLLSNSLIAADAARRAEELLSATADAEEAVAGADLVLESTPEDMQAKQALFARLEKLCKVDAILASNTSGLSITALAANCRHPQRVITAHFWNPPHLMPLVELVCGKQTDPQIAQTLREVLLRCGKLPVIVKRDTPGQLGNRLQTALVREAINIVAEGIADVEDVDLAARSGFGLRLPVYGVFEHLDMIGLDMGQAIMDYVATDLFNQPSAPSLLKEKVARGELGVKAGRGFYEWSEERAEEVRRRRDEFVLSCLKKFRGR
jgi:3-hydroxybutyryl-CoA dehydrogenase